MASRRDIHRAYNEHLRQASAMMHRGQLLAAHHPREPPPPPVLLENELASQAAEIDKLAADNHILATSHLNLRRNLIAAQQEAENLTEHIKSIQTEGDIQIRLLLDKIAKMEADIRAGKNIKKELEEAYVEARSLATTKLELTVKLQKATQDLDKARADIKKLPEMHAQLSSLRQEHQRLRKTFEYEKGLNIVKVEQMRSLEKDLIGVAEEVERLRAQVLDAENRANAPIPSAPTPAAPIPPAPIPAAPIPSAPIRAAPIPSAPIPYNGPYMNPDNGPYMNPGTAYPTSFYGNGGYVDSFGIPLQMVNGPVPDGMNSYLGGGYGFAPRTVSSYPVGPPGVGGPVPGPGGTYAVGPGSSGPAAGPGGNFDVGPPGVSSVPGGNYAGGPPGVSGQVAVPGNPAWGGGVHNAPSHT